MILWILIFDLSAQAVYLNGPLFRVPETTQWAPFLGLLFGVIGFYWKSARRPCMALLLILHYCVTYSDGLGTSAGDTWVWLLATVLVFMPDEGAVTKDYWVGVLKLVGFLVYFFAGLNKMIHKDWWNGEALINAFASPEIVKDPFPILANWPSVCKYLCWFTLFQRLVIPWGLWSRKFAVRRICAGILVFMHVTYMFSLNIGPFSLIGVAYLIQFFFPPVAGEDYYRLPKFKGYWSPISAGIFSFYLILVPSFAFAQKFGFPNPGNMTLPGVTMQWNMFADSLHNLIVPEYSIKTCDGKEFFDDQIYWDFGTNKDYFRRRSIRGWLHHEWITQSGKKNELGPIEQRLIANFPEIISERRLRLFVVDNQDKKNYYDSGYQVVGQCTKF